MTRINLKPLIIWSIAGPIGGVSAVFAVGSSQYNNNPHLVAKLPFANGFAFERLADQATMNAAVQNPDVSKVQLGSDAKRNALLAFDKEPTAFDAIRAMAIIKQNEQDINAARKLMRNLATLTKRDAFANYWLIYDYGRQGDLDKVLRYYDMTMRASDGSIEVLMPAMIRALGNKNSIGPFASILQDRPPWEGRFWVMASHSEEALDNALDLKLKLLNDGIEYPLSIDLELLNQLVQYQKYEGASRLYLALDKRRSKATQRLVNDHHFSNLSTLPPFDWELFGTGEYGAFISESSQSMSISATADAGGIVARQLVMLTPRSYRLIVKTDYKKNDGPAPISLRVYCAKYGEQGRRDPVFSSSTKKIGGTFLVPSASCRYHWLEIVALPINDIEGYDITISKIDLQIVKETPPKVPTTT